MHTFCKRDQTIQCTDQQRERMAPDMLYDKGQNNRDEPPAVIHYQLLRTKRRKEKKKEKKEKEDRFVNKVSY